MAARTCALVALATAMALLAPSAASGYYEKTSGPNTVLQCSCHAIGMPNPTDPAVLPSCQRCHGYTSTQFPLAQYDSPSVGKGPHGFYSALTNKCQSCHSLHGAKGDSLLPTATIVATCYTCHDGTGGFGVYGLVKARTGQDPSGHRIGVTNVVPGGDPETGGPSTRTFDGPGGTLICTDCHSVHDRQTVTPFMGERKRTRSWEKQDRPTSKLLKRQPTGASVAVSDYGSDWCMSCHAGSMSGGTTMNHPVDSLRVNATPFTYRRVAGGRSLGIYSLGDRHNRTDRYEFGLGNRDYLMADPRDAAQGTHGPICQQCHEDSREAGTLSASGVPVVTTLVAASADGLASSDNPRFQVFPHETANPSLLLEVGDNLCLNCHISP